MNGRGAEQGGGEGSAGQLLPEMGSRRLQVLAFIRDYLARWGQAPSQGEIANALQITRTTAHRALRSLAADGLIRRTGQPRGILLPSAEHEALAVLRQLGWLVAGGADSRLLSGPVLDYLPPTPKSGDPNGQGKQARAREAGAATGP